MKSVVMVIYLMSATAPGRMITKDVVYENLNIRTIEFEDIASCQQAQKLMEDIPMHMNLIIEDKITGVVPPKQTILCLSLK